MKIQFAILLIVILTIASCSNEKTNEKIVVKDSDSLHYTTFADSIIYDVIVKASNTNDTWQMSCLEPFKREAFIDTLFNALYRGDLIAYSYETKQALSIAQIKEIEKQAGYSRNIIGKYQFSEQWKYDSQSKRMIKIVHSITFGYETYYDDGSTKEYYLPLFKVIFN